MVLEMRKMKDSGIEWIREIPEGWEVAKLKNIVSIVRGGSPRPIEAYMSDNDNDVNWIRISDTEKGSKYITHTSRKLIASGISKSRFIKRGSLILTNSMSFGEPYILDIDGCIHDGWVAFSDFKKIDKEFLYYFLTSPLAKIQFEQQVDGGVVKNLNIDKIGDTVILLPSLIDQNKIIVHLDSLTSETNSLLSKTITSIEEYKKLKQAVITQAVTKGVRGEREMKDSGVEWIKELPSDWGIIPSKYLFKNSDTKKINGDEQLTASQQHGIITQKYYTELTGSKVVLANKGLDDWKHVEPFDFIISLRSFQGGLEMSETTGCITWHYIVLKPCRQIYSYYYKWLFKSEIYIRALQRTCNFIRDGQDLRYSNFVQVPLFEPPLEEQKGIADYLNGKCAEIDKLIAKKEQLVKELEGYKKSLIYEFVTGKREV
ncbi:restriction endonuclease subunit S [Faecalibacterium prausnitzii]|uniref:Restriction endonuclease subunit S n=2 Tax=Faecalibacterium prausnitzii TaxID=853 RepID=A0A291T6S2_9FIRM|nr:restriction endonuclease subunit S [Faecalibacterium prausnitzii]